MHYYKDLGNGNLQEIIGGEIPADAIVSAEPIVMPAPVVVEPEPYIPTAEEIAAQTKQQLIWTVQNHLDAAARALGYDDIKTAVTYADEPAVLKFQTEGKAFRAWRSLVWAACYAILDDVLAGERLPPTIDELLAELPVLGANDGG